MVTGMQYAVESRTRILQRSCRVAVVGLGYVGLPLAVNFAEAGFSVWGVDNDVEKVARLQRRETDLAHLDGPRLARVLEQDALRVSSDPDSLRAVDVVLICVPTPLTAHRDPDLSALRAVGTALAGTLQRGQLIVLESTSYPGTTGGLLRDLLQSGGLRCGEDFFLAFSPERQDPGNACFSMADIPKVVGADDPLSAQLAELLYGQVVTSVVRVSSSATAEATKLTENVFRAVNIALVNELKMIYEQLGVDIWEVLKAADTKPFGFMRFDPGPGWGGHCIPLDPYYLAWQARAAGMDARFVELAGQINRAMPAYVVERLQQALNLRGKMLNGSQVILLGVTYKKNVPDLRESPALALAELLFRSKAQVRFHDPLLAAAPAVKIEPLTRYGTEAVALTPDVLAACAAVVVVTDHAGVDYAGVLEHAPLVIDCRGVYGHHPKVVRA